MKFISDEEWSEFEKQPSKELFNEILSRVFNAAIETTITKIPDVIARLLKSTAATQNMTKDFFVRNKDFNNHKDIVRTVIQDVESLHPEWTYDAILKEAEGIIKLKIEGASKQTDLPLDKPTKVNLNGNGII